MWFKFLFSIGFRIQISVALTASQITSFKKECGCGAFRVQPEQIHGVILTNDNALLF